MRPAFYDNPKYKKLQAKMTRKYWELGLYNALRKSSICKKCLNPSCTKFFPIKPHEIKKYCGSSCAAHVNNSQRQRRTPKCLVCSKFTKRLVLKYCSLKCQSLDKYNKYINRWKQGLETGTIGIATKTISAHLRRYLSQKYGDKCSVCGWSQIHPITKVVPLEVDHIDGNAENNKEENLRVICPNCHSLTPSFRNLNKGNGREWRIKYLKNTKLPLPQARKLTDN